MNVEELFGLTEWVDERIVKEGLHASYSSLHSVLNSNAQPNTEAQPLDPHRSNLDTALRGVPLNELTREQSNYLECIGIVQWVGVEAAAAVEDVLFRNAIDSATAAAHMQKGASAIQAGVNRSNAIRDSLAPCLPATSSDELPREILLRVGFEGDASITNMVEFQRWARKWHEIGRGITMAHGESPESIKVVGASKGSIILELAIQPEIARSFALIITTSLVLAEQFHRVRRQAREVRKLDLEIEEKERIAKDLEENADRIRTKGAEEITDRLRISLEIEVDDASGDVIIALGKSVKGLLDFVDKGGSVDLVVPPEAEVAGDDGEAAALQPMADELRQLRAQVEEIRQKEDTLRLLAAPEDLDGTPD